MRKNRITLKLALAGFAFAMFFAFSNLSSFADSTATVSVESAYIRASASTSGDIVAGAMKDDKLSIIETVTDSAGNTWYKVWVDSKVTGYIRADLVTTSGDVPAASNSGSSSTSSDSGSSNSNDNSSQTSASASTSSETVDTTPIISTDLVVVEPVEGTTTGDVRVRKGPSTNTDVIDNVTKGTTGTITGYEETSEGETWYYITYGSKSGYIRSDFMSLSGELVKVEENPVPAEPEETEVPEPEPEPEPEVYMDYEVDYKIDEEGNTVWCLKDYTEGTQYDIKEIIEAKKKLEETTKEAEKKLKKKQLGIVVLSIVVVLLLAGGAAAYIVFRRWYYGYDETEEPVTTKRESSRSTSDTYSSRTKTSSAQTQTRRASEDFKMETVGAKSSTTSASSSTPTRLTRKDLEGAEFLEDGEHIRLANGTIVKATRAKKTADGGYAATDGTTRYTGTATGTSSQSTTTVPRTSAKARNFADDDDMDYGFLHSGSSHDDD